MSEQATAEQPKEPAVQSALLEKMQTIMSRAIMDCTELFADLPIDEKMQALRDLHIYFVYEAAAILVAVARNDGRILDCVPLVTAAVDAMTAKALTAKQKKLDLHCPDCGQKNESTLGNPGPGAIGVCSACFGWAILGDDEKLHKPTDEQRAAILGDPIKAEAIDKAITTTKTWMADRKAAQAVVNINDGYDAAKAAAEAKV